MESRGKCDGAGPLARTGAAVKRSEACYGMVAVSDTPEYDV